MNREEAQSCYVAMCFNPKNVKNAICERKVAIMRRYMGGFVNIAALLLTKYFSYNHKYDTSATALKPQYDVNHISDFAFSLFGRKFSDSTL